MFFQRLTSNIQFNYRTIRGVRLLGKLSNQKTPASPAGVVHSYDLQKSSPTLLGASSKVTNTPG
jgi:hypothetical protein